MKFNRKIIPDTNYKPNFITKKRFYEEEINFVELILNNYKKNYIN